MHVNNFTLPRPPQESLDQCFCVYIGDPVFNIKKMRNWCWDNNLSLVWSELVDTSDVDYNYDHVAAFWFIDARDAIAFTLKFK
jgi:hypothetical protein